MTISWNPTAKDQALRTLSLPKPGTPLDRQTAQSLAVTVAWRGLGRVAPNPLVGAVIVDGQHRFLAAGAHHAIGQDHAEIDAFKALDASGFPQNKSLSDATLYVTLEPCAHQNKTPACAPRLVERGIGKVVFGVTDPNPLVNGKGVAILKAAGVACEHDLNWQADCEDLAEIFLWNVRHKRPFVGLKAAASLNGVLARRGDSRVWITGERARQYGHFLRSAYDAIVVGSQTLLDDNPQLDTRDSLVPGRNPIKVVLDPTGRALQKLVNDKTCRVLAHEPEKTVWVLAENIDASLVPVVKGARVLHVPYRDGDGSFQLDALLTSLQANGIHSLLLEGGAGLYRHFLAAGLVNKLHLFQAPKIISGSDVINWVTVTEPAETQLADKQTITPLGDDWLLEAVIRR